MQSADKRALLRPLGPSRNLTDEVMERMVAMDRSGSEVFADVFPAIAVSFARYC